MLLSATHADQHVHLVIAIKDTGRHLRISGTRGGRHVDEDSKNKELYLEERGPRSQKLPIINMYN
jgi:hypothetical protein